MRVLETLPQSAIHIESFAPELQLLLQCTQPGAGNLAAAVAGQSVSWKRTIEIARHAGLLPILAERLADIEGPGMDEQVRQDLGTYLRDNTARNLYLRQCAIETIAVLEGAGIPALQLKGPNLAERLYGHPGLRECQDIDLLVHSSDMGSALDTLLRADYSKVTDFNPAQERAVLRHNAEYQLRSPEGILVEVQWRLLPAYFCVGLHEEELWHAARAELKPEMEFLGLLLNGGKERWGKLITVLDLAQFFHQYPNLEWSAVHRHALDLGLRRWLEMGTELAQRLFRCEAPAVLLPPQEDRVRDSLVAEYLRDLACDSVVLDDKALHNFLLRIRERDADRIRYALRVATTPGRAEWELVELPVWAAWLYYPIRMVRAAGKLLTERGSGGPRRRSEP